MPVLHQHQTLFHHYILTSIEGKILTFQVTPEGVSKLRTLGVLKGHKFDRRLLFALYRDGELSTVASGTLESLDQDRSQPEFDFAEDLTSDSEFPICDCCGTLRALSLVVVKSASRSSGEVTCAECFSSYGLASDFQTTLPVPKDRLVATRSYLTQLSRKTANVIRLERILLSAA